jgi:probable F420-dependent oxidoreductase
MTTSSLEAVTPALSLGLRNFSAEDPGTWQALLDLTRTADEVGIDRLVVSDHVVFGENLDAYGRPEVGGSKGGKQPTGPDGHWLDPLTLLTFVAGMTTNVRLATGILIAALRRPIVLAKMASTLDVLSNGRLDLGVGVGWQREEYVAAGLSFEGRGRLLDHTLEVCEAAWRDTDISYRSDELQFDRIHQMPKPLQAGGVPIWVSGTLNQRVIDRVVRFGSGWIPWGDDIADPAKGIGVMRDALEAAGRGATLLQVTTGLPTVKGADGNLDIAATMEGVPPLVEAGITDFRVYAVPTDPSAARDHLAELVTAFRATVGRPSP